jgi:hypothetical protein
MYTLSVVHSLVKRIFSQVREFSCITEVKSSESSSRAACIATNARQVLSRVLDIGMPWLSRLWIGCGADIPHKNSIAPKPQQQESHGPERGKSTVKEEVSIHFTKQF